MTERSRRARIGLRYLALLVSCGVFSSPHATRAELTNRIVAVVNDEVVTEGDVRSHMSALLQREPRSSAASQATPEMRRSVIQRLIDERLIIQEAKKQGLSVSPEDVTSRLKAIRSQLGPAQAYTQMLEESGLTEEQLKDKLREQLLTQKAIDREIRSKLTVSPAEMAKASPAPPAAAQGSEEVRAYHLLIRVTEQRSVEDARQLIDRISTQLRHGASFEDVARQYSEDPYAQRGGLMDWVRQGELLPELDHVLFHLPPGELSSPFQTRLGFHLVKVVERRNASSGTTVDPAPEQRLYQEKFMTALSQWLQELRQRAYIEVVSE